MPRSPSFRLWALTLLALVCLLAWDASGLDLPIARLSGTPVGFPWRNNVFLENVMHTGAKNLSWVFTIALFAAIRWPLGVLRRLSVAERAQLAFTVLTSVLAIVLLKHANRTSCPWDLQEFGGAARYVSHWALGVYDGGPGKCFPAGHASAAFCYVGGYFVLRRVSPAAARVWFAAALVAGFVLGGSQQMRGAHYMSHTFWTGWICWLIGLVIDEVVTRSRFFGRGPQTQSTAPYAES
jgi:membrane-associated PAP2 superfamily phosphatase